MSNSQFCIQQRHKQEQQLKKLLILGFAGSAALHGILAYALPHLSFESPQQVKEPIELILVDKPAPKPEPKPKPKVESKPVVEPEPKPEPQPEPVKAQTPPPPPKPPEPTVRPTEATASESAKQTDGTLVPFGVRRKGTRTEAQTPPPKPVPEPTPAPTPAPKEVLTTPTPAPSQPIVSAPVANTAQPSDMSSSLSASSSSVATSSSSNSGGSINGKPGVTGSVVATGSAPPRPEASSEPSEGINCVSNCEPEYPAALDGVEGSAGVKLTIDTNGNVIGAELADADSNSLVNRQALLAARQMQFSSPGDSSASVQVKIDFTVEGSEYDRLAREEQERKEQAAREREEQEAAARQQQLEAETQAQQEQLERERQARQRQQEQQATPTPEAKPAPEPLPALSPEELDEERLRKFRERMENYQN